MTDNFEILKSLLKFELGIHTIQIIQRSKDGGEKSSRTVAEFNVTSENQFDFLRPGIISLCNEYNARAYLNLNPKLDEAVLYKVMELAIDKVKSKVYKPLNLISSALGNCHGNGWKVWVIDVDEKEVDLELVRNRIEQCQSGYTTNVIDVVPTKNGYHILTVPFNLQQLNKDGLPEFEIKKNAPTLLFCP